MNEEHRREITIFLEAIEIDDPKRLADYLDEACSGNSRLRVDVNALLAAHRRDNSFLERPAPGLDQTVDLERDALEAGLSKAFASDASVVIGEANHSVLNLLGRKLAKVPRVALRDSDSDGPIESPRSAQVPPDGGEESKYQLHGEIARGGMGAIIKGRDKDLGRDLAIKVLLDSQKDKPEIIERFVEEAQIGGQLQHPGIVPVYELGQFSDERPFFSMKLIKGETLAALLASRSETGGDQSKLLGIFDQICQAMAYAHSRGVIHRDLKPANVMVGTFGEVQVMDWGLAKVLRKGGVTDEVRSREQHRDVSVIRTRRSEGSDSPDDIGSQTHMGSVMGTPAYMAPEQALGEIDRLDERADVFGLGAILCEILTGKPPYVGEDGTHVFRQASRGKLKDCFERLDASCAEPELIAIAKQALAPEPEQRWRHSGELAGALGDHLKGVQERLRQSEIARSKAQARAEEEGRRRKLQLVITAMALAMALATAFVANRFRRQGQIEADLKDEAQQQSEQLAEQLRNTKVAQLTAKSEAIRYKTPIRSLLVAMEAIDLARDDDATNLSIAHEALMSATQVVGGRPLEGRSNLVGPYGDDQDGLAISNDSRWLAIGGKNIIRVWDLFATSPAAKPLVLRGHADDIRSLAFAPDSRHLVSGSRDKTARLWDLAQDDPAAAPLVLDRHRTAVESTEISPDGRWVVTAGTETMLWDLTATDPTSTPLVLCDDKYSVSNVAFGSDNRWLVTCGRRNEARLYDLTAENPAGSERVLTGHKSKVFNVAVSPDGHRLATSDWDSTVRLWDLTLDNPAEASLALNGHHGHVNSLAFDPTGRWLLTGCFDQTARIWDLSTSDPNNDPVVLRGHEHWISVVRISSDGRWGITGSYDNTVRLWDLTSDDPASTSTVVAHHDDAVVGVETSADGRWLVTATRSDSPRLWEFPDPHTPPTPSPFVLPGRMRSISPDGRWLVTSRQNRTRLWDLDSKAPATSSVDLVGFEPNGRYRVAISSDSRWLTSAGMDGTVGVWDLNSVDPGSAQVSLRGHTAPINCLAISEDGRTLITGSEDKTARVWELGNERGESSFLLPGHAGEVTRVWIDDGGRRCATLSGNEARVWDLSSKTVQDPLVVSIPMDAYGMTMTRDSRWLVISGVSNSLHQIMAWDISGASPSPRVLKGHTRRVQAMETTPDGRWLATGSWDKTVRLWDLTAEDPWESSVVLSGHSGSVENLAISKDGQWLVSASADSTACLWGISGDPPAKPAFTLRGHRRIVWSACVSSAANRVASTDDNEVRLWELDVDRLYDRARQLAGREFALEEQADYLGDQL